MRHLTKISLIVCLLLVQVGLAASPSGAQGEPTPPGQPAWGPGGSAYPHRAVTATQYGTGETAYWLFEPDQPRPESAPVVVFVHGFLAIPPAIYQGWIDHIVQKGNLVIYPTYQLPGTPPREFTANALAGVQAALLELQGGNHVSPELDKFALTGHSCGGVIATDLAALALSNGLPEPDALLPVTPGCGFQPQDWGQIPASSKLVVMVAEDDFLVGDSTAREIWDRTPQIGSENKDYLTVVADRYGSPPLPAGHSSPLASPAVTNATDFFGYWKIFEALHDCAWYGQHCEYALGGGLQQRFMGRWSDGRPVNPMLQTDAP